MSIGCRPLTREMLGLAFDLELDEGRLAHRNPPGRRLMRRHELTMKTPCWSHGTRPGAAGIPRGWNAAGTTDPAGWPTPNRAAPTW